MNKKGKIRNQNGSIVSGVAVAAFMILLPLGLFSFEIARLFLAQLQLRNAVDAAALGAVTGMIDPDINAPQKSQAEINNSIKQLALVYFKRNLIVSNALNSAILSPTVGTDNPSAGRSSFNLTIDNTNGKVRAEGAFGLRPAFSGFLGLGTVTIRANSIGGFKGAEGDIVIACDISDSMTLGTGLNGPGTTVIARQYRKNPPAGTYKLSYKTVKAGTSKTPPSLRTLGNHLRVIPNPDLADFSKSPLFSGFKNAPYDVKVAALIESKRGNLNSQAAYDKAKVADSVLGDPNLPWKGQIKIGEDYRGAYQEAALPFVHPLADAKKDVIDFANFVTTKNPDVHVALVGFAPYAGGAPNKKQYSDNADLYNTYGQSATKDAEVPVVRLSQSQNKAKELVDAMNPCVTFSGTNTTSALKVAHSMLIGPGHRKGKQQTIVLLTDGIPTVGGYIQESKKIGADGIRILAIGFFHTNYAKNRGPKVCTKIVRAAQNGSRYFPADGVFDKDGKGNKGYYTGSELEALKKAFELAAKGEPALLNN